ncbi:MAG: hypothetical protein HN856_05375 [Gammaproteobacteria bacterium]|nr:hypothetical protein [Gammaproteobacteria bacterium]MCH1551640.1 hypothetical protein [Pseudomonadales bacterium]
MKRILAFILAVLAAYVLAVLMYTQLNLANVVELGLPVTAQDRVSAALHDLQGMLGLYLPIIGIALFIAFAVTHQVLRWVPQLRTLGYMLGGFAGIYVVDLMLVNVLGSGIHPLSVTRTTVGLLSQCVAGAVGGLVFVRLLPMREPA